MKVIYNTQVSNPEKHALMPDGYPFITYEVEDDYPEEDLLSQGYNILSLELFNSYKESFDLTDYLLAIDLSEDERIKQSLARMESICDEVILNLKVSMVKQGIVSPVNGQVSVYLHNLLHYLEVQAIDEAYNEIDALIAAGVPSELSPYVTEEILTDFKSELMSRIAAL